MASKAVTTQAPAGLPDLAPTSPEDFQLDSRDIQPPRIKVASPTTGAAKDGKVPNFCLFTEKGSDDADPVVLVKPGETDGIKVYVLKMYKTWAANVDPSNYEIEMGKGGELRRFYSLDQAPAFIRANEAQGGTRYRQYNYVVYCPDSPDSDLPHNLLLAKTSTPAARAINTAISQRMQEGLPTYASAFELWPVRRDSDENTWAIFKARPAAADPEHVDAAAELLELVKSKPAPTFEEAQPETVNAEPAPAI